jgi:hypothetical protein
MGAKTPKRKTSTLNSDPWRLGEHGGLIRSSSKPQISRVQTAMGAKTPKKKTSTLNSDPWRLGEHGGLTRSKFGTADFEYSNRHGRQDAKY